MNSIDTDKIKQLVNADNQFLVLMSHTFQIDTLEHLNKLDIAIKNANLPEIKQEVYYIKCSCSDLGAADMLDILEQFNAVLAIDKVPPTELYNKLTYAYRVAVAHLFCFCNSFATNK
jgi:hypothetical protein